jgi:hypothetical protein
MEEMVNPESQSQPVEPEKRFTQADLDALAGRVRQETRQKALEEAKRESMTQPQLNENDFRRIAGEETRKQAEEMARAQMEQMHMQQAKTMLNDFRGQIASGKEKYPDIEQQIEELQLHTMPELIGHAMKSGNTVEFMREAALHPQKALAIAMAEKMGNNVVANKLSKALSDSIKKNLEAAAQAEASPKDPLRHVKPSNVGGDDGATTIAELRKQKHLRV